MKIKLAILMIVTLYIGFGYFDHKMNSIQQKVLRGEEIYLPSISFPALGHDQSNLTNNDLMGHYSILNIFGSWCGSCRAKHPYLVDVEKTSKLKIFGIAVKDNPNLLNSFLDSKGNPYEKIGLDYDSEISRLMRIKGIPLTLLINPKGRIIFVSHGKLDKSYLKKVIFEDSKR